MSSAYETSLWHNKPKPLIASEDSIASRSGSRKTMNKNAEKGQPGLTPR